MRYLNSMHLSCFYGHVSSVIFALWDKLRLIQKLQSSLERLGFLANHVLQTLPLTLIDGKKIYIYIKCLSHISWSINHKPYIFLVDVCPNSQEVLHSQAWIVINFVPLPTWCCGMKWEPVSFLGLHVTSEGWCWSGVFYVQILGAVLVYRCLTNIDIHIIKKRRSDDPLLFLMGISMPGKMVFILK